MGTFSAFTCTLPLGRLLDPVEGYHVSVRRHISSDGEEIYSAYATDRAGNYVGQAEAASHSKKSGYLEVGMVEVVSAHRRKGVASAMYRAIESASDKRLAPSGVQTAAGAALWRGGSAEQRQFGRLPSKGRLPMATAKRALKALGRKARQCAITPAELREGMEVEREHRDVTGGAMLKTAKIASAHLCERKDYYKRLKRYVER